VGAAAAQGGPERFFRGGEAVRDQAPKLRPLDHFVLPDCKQSGPPRGRIHDATRQIKLDRGFLVVESS